ncbi:hypothetical protein M011DRAFT_463081 [Sporormia fimetaria CBS 119925]|uniref:Uncharacterized protein n=1 Tax=Sporormia fimetaria CBS 119925 TaxID=1340428 RepID=A0A6A6UXC8_9PLEO|nr:hypothetical protein M011DRAFT_463081 [Sporormia fimetaria CBS 119925]
MAGLPPPPPPQFGVPGYQRHFWEPGCTAYLKIIQLNNDINQNGLATAQSRLERPVTNMWKSICLFYFRQITNIPNGPVWAVDAESLRGSANNQAEHIPDIVVLKLWERVGPPGLPGQLPQVDSRDYLWVECKKDAEDSAAGWKNVIHEATTRLKAAHVNNNGTRNIYLIIAIGTKCMCFVFDPLNQYVGPRLHIASDKGGVIWQMDPMIKLPWTGARYVSAAPATVGRILWEKAYKLDTHSLDANGWLKRGPEMGMIEGFLHVIRTMPNLPGINPAHFN